MGDFQGRLNASSAALLSAERPRRLADTIGAALRQALLGCALVAAGLSLALRTAAANPVTDWTVLADRIGGGSANWHTLAIMHRAMHDAFNAALPIYARWDPPSPNEPSGAGAVPEAAMASAGREVIALLHPAASADADRLLQKTLDRIEPGSARDAAVALGRVIGAAAVARRQNDGYERRYRFVSDTTPGKWRAPPEGAGGYTETRPFLFRNLDDASPMPPPPLGSEAYRAGVETTRRLGAEVTPDRTPEQAETAEFWAYQLPQRGVMLYAVDMLNRYPRPLGEAEEARIMSQMASAMADSAILTWEAKRRYQQWRPITAIQQGGFGVVADPNWRPLIETPNHPEYPSGHASDCYTGAALLTIVFGKPAGGVTYTAGATTSAWSDGSVPDVTETPLTGPNRPRTQRRWYADGAAVAKECGQSRVWAGVHFPAAADEGRRLGSVIAARAAAAVPPLR